MIRWRNILFVLVLFGSLMSCVEKYWPNIDKYENLMVVDGLVTNGSDTTVVNLSVSTSMNDSELLPLSGAEVYISDQNSLIFQLVELEIGSYRVTSNDFTPSIGNSYQLHIIHPNGKKYESDICLLTEPSPIDSVYGIIDSYEVANGSHDIVGLQFYVDNHGVNNDTNNYLWRLSQTYKYRASFSLDYLWEGRMIRVNSPDSLRTCWRTKPVADIFTYSTRHLDNSIIKKYPLNFVSTETKILSIRYSLYVEQLKISNDAFTFWDALMKQSVGQDNLYNQQPFQIRGNVRNIMDDNEVVLGYFTVAGITKKRIFVNRPPGVSFYYSYCEPDFDGMMMLGNSSPVDWPIFITETAEGGKALAGSDACFDCRMAGGSLTPPDFWEE